MQEKELNKNPSYKTETQSIEALYKAIKLKEEIGRDKTNPRNYTDFFSWLFFNFIPERLIGEEFANDEFNVTFIKTVPENVKNTIGSSCLENIPRNIFFGKTKDEANEKAYMYCKRYGQEWVDTHGVLVKLSPYEAKEYVKKSLENNILPQIHLSPIPSIKLNETRMKKHYAFIPTRVQTWRGTYATVWLQEYYEDWGNLYCLRLGFFSFED